MFLHYICVHNLKSFPLLDHVSLWLMLIWFVKGFDNLRNQSVAPPQWTMRNVDDRYAKIMPWKPSLNLWLHSENLLYYVIYFSLLMILYCRNRLLLCILNICKDVLGHLPKVVGIDVVEMALWAKVHIHFSLLQILHLTLWRCLLETILVSDTSHFRH